MNTCQYVGVFLHSARQPAHVEKMPLLSRGVTVHKYDGSVHTSVLTSRFGMISVQRGENKPNLFFCLLFL